MNLKPLPVGVEDFEKLIRRGYYYVDKTPFIKELLDKKGDVNLFTRPRRFGKTLNMSMLQKFFDVLEQESADVFEGLAISQAGADYLAHQNAYPVINFSLKNVEASEFVLAFDKFQDLIIHEFDRQQYLLESERLTEKMKSDFKQVLYWKFNIINQIPNEGNVETVFENSLWLLCHALQAHYGKKVIILIDEYDVPLEKAYFNGFYEQMLNFVRNWFHKALKINNALEFAVMTGCLRVSKESIFTGLNNLHILSITSNMYAEYFGFTEKEVLAMLDYYDLMEKKDEIRTWYNGYLFGNTVVYNPWSVIKYMFDMVEAKARKATAFPESYWSNTSSNAIIKHLVEIADEETKEEIEALVRGESITKAIKSDIVYGEFNQDMEHLWSFLLFTGYLKQIRQKFDGKKLILDLKIPNLEVSKIYEDKILEWFKQKVKLENPRELVNAITQKDAQTLEESLNEKLLDMISFHDTQESFYHGFLIGILSNLPGFRVVSNREAGKGRSDIFMKHRGISKQGIVFELKVIKDNEDPEQVCQSALKQIRDKGYDGELAREGYRNILKYGIAFRGKECLVMVEGTS